MQAYLRDAVDSDLPDLVGLLHGWTDEAALDDPRLVGAIADALAEIDRTDGCYVLVAEIGGRVAGMVQLTTFRHLQHRGGRCAEIETLRTDPRLAGHQVAAQLVDRAVERARELGCYRIQVTVAHERIGHHELLEQRGFTASHHGYKLSLDQPALVGGTITPR